MSNETILHLEKAGSFFVYNFIELTILFLGVSFLVEILNLYINPTKVQRVLSSNKGGYLIASALGSLTPFCSCSTIPLTLGLLKAKAAFGPIMTFLFTSPLLNPIVVAVFWSAFGYEVTLIYALIAFFVSILAGFTLEKFGFERFVKKELFEEDDINSCASRSCGEEKSKEQSSCCDTPKVAPVMSFSITKPTSSCCDSPKEKVQTSCCDSNNEIINQSSCCDSEVESKKEGFFKKISDQALLKKTWKQFLSFAPYIAIGIGIGAFVHGFVPKELLTQYAGVDNPYAIFVAAIIGIPLYIRASSMVGLAPALIDGGVGMGAILALTVAGAGASLPEMIMLKKIFKLPIMIFFLISVFGMAIGCGFLVNLYFS
jgi:uncharacterized membrane protein YraQ (UPF0718 family)